MIIQDAIKTFWSHLIETKYLSNGNSKPENPPTNEAMSKIKSTIPINSPALKRPNKLANVPTTSPVTKVAPKENESLQLNSLETTFEANEKLARKLFFDLPSDGKDGTMGILAASCVRLVFGVNWTS